MKEYLIGFACGVLAVVFSVGARTTPIDTRIWHCTKSIVINTELPREEACVQYTKQLKEEDKRL